MDLVESFNGRLGFYSDLMRIYSDFMGFYSDFMGYELDVPSGNQTWQGNILFSSVTFPAINLHSVRGFSIAMFDDTRG